MILISNKDNLQIPDPMTIEYLEAMAEFEGEELDMGYILAPTKLSVANCKIAHQFLNDHNIIHNLDCDSNGGTYIEIIHPAPKSSFNFYFCNSGKVYYWLIAPAPCLTKSDFYDFQSLEEFNSYYQNLIFI